MRNVYPFNQLIKQKTSLLNIIIFKIKPGPKKCVSVSISNGVLHTSVFKIYKIFLWETLPDIPLHAIPCSSHIFKAQHRSSDYALAFLVV